MAIQKTAKAFLGINLPGAELSARQTHLYWILSQRLIENISERVGRIGREEQHRLAAILHGAADRVCRGNGCLANPTFSHEEAESGHEVILAYRAWAATACMAERTGL